MGRYGAIGREMRYGVVVDAAGEKYWTQTPQQLASKLGTDLAAGLDPSTRTERLLSASDGVRRMHPALRILLGQFKSPIQLLLIAAACLSFSLRQPVDGTVVLAIIIGSAIVSFQHEYRADQAVSKLLAMVETKSRVLQGGKVVEIPSKQIAPGDVVLLDAGTMVPADGVIIESVNLFADEAALTGETFPVEKAPGPVEADAELKDRLNMVFSGSHIVSGAAKCLIVAAGAQTELGSIAKSLVARRPEAEFERGLRHFGALLVNLTILLTLGVFAINAAFGRPVLESFLFALALAVGLTPQLLPAIVSVNLSRGAVDMAAANVIVKRLAAIESLGTMTVLCSDKTGTLTQGIVKVHGAYDLEGQPSADVLRLAQIDALRQTGFRNPIDEGLVASIEGPRENLPQALGEIPYDFIRKRISVLVEEGGAKTLISKGALEPMLAICGTTEAGPLDAARERIQALFSEYSAQGLRVLGIATKSMPNAATSIAAADEGNLVLRGFVVLEDPLRDEIVQTVSRLGGMGIELKIITGDNRLVAATLGKSLQLKNYEPLIGKELQALSDRALLHQVRRRQVFAEIEPNQKARIVAAIKRAGGVVGYIGDGINDGAALHAADAGISVANAVDVAKEAADFVMLQPGLDVLCNAVVAGRRTFANTMKYLFMATSANFGNMFSLAGASLLVPFLPLLPKQVLMMNFITDVPEMFIATDTVDSGQLEKPQRWDLGFLKRFMLVFGILSSAFDFATFLTLLYLKVPERTFRTAWFVESVVSAALIVLVVRTRLPFFRTRPGKGLLWATCSIVPIVFLLPYSPLAAPLGLGPLPAGLLAAVVGIIAAYFLCAELVKRLFYRSARRA